MGVVAEGPRRNRALLLLLAVDGLGLLVLIGVLVSAIASDPGGKWQQLRLEMAVAFAVAVAADTLLLLRRRPPWRLRAGIAFLVAVEMVRVWLDYPDALTLALAIEQPILALVCVYAGLRR